MSGPAPSLNPAGNGGVFSSAKPDVALAILTLRNLRGETQEKFCRQVGVALATVARWEIRDRHPGPMSLVRLWSLARGQKRPDLAQIFDAAIHKRMGCSIQALYEDLESLGEQS